MDALTICLGLLTGLALLHEEDLAACECGYAITGKKFSAPYAKKLGLVTCEHCNGKGVVDGRK